MQTTTHNTELIHYAINGLTNVSEGIYACDLHNSLFNRDYFIIGYYQAEQWLINNVGIFNAIDIVKEYEENNFGALTTDISSSEKLVNMYAYIIGEEILNNCPTLTNNWDERLTLEQLNNIEDELASLLTN